MKAPQSVFGITFLLAILLSVSCAPFRRDSAADSKLAGSATDHCMDADVVGYAMPIYPGRSNSPTFTYRIQASATGDANKPVIVFLPGGPGYTSMGSRPKGIPSDYRYVSTDQRGTGCNDLADSNLPLDSITSDNMAEDVVAAIEAMHLNNYIIYGHSFGTLHSTKVVAKIEDRFRSGGQIHLPKAVVLEGIIGKAFTGDTWMKPYQQEWNKVKSRLPADVVQQLSRQPLPFSDVIPAASLASKWGMYIRGMLYWGRFPASNGNGDLGYSLQVLHQPVVNSVDYIRLAQRVAGSDYQGYFPIFLNVNCNDLYENFQGELILKDGELVGSGPNLCAGKKFDRPFDSMDYYISTPIFYFQGEADPATPAQQAHYHFKSHGAAARTYVQLDGVGHEPLQTTLFPCLGLIWDDIVTGGATLSQTLRQCPGVKAVTAKDVEVNATEMYLSWK